MNVFEKVHWRTVLTKWRCYSIDRSRTRRHAGRRKGAGSPLAIEGRGVGPEFAAVLWGEGLFRHFDNRRRVAAYAGLAPTPWQSGSFDREQGIGKSGNPRLRSRLLEMAWLWVRNQPGSLLCRWFNDRVARNGGRFKKVMITALARKLVVASSKYVSAGVLIENSHQAVTTLVNHSSSAPPKPGGRPHCGMG